MLKLYVTGNYFFAVNSAGNIFSCHKSKAVIRYDEMDDEKFDIYLEGVRLFDAVIYSNITNESNIPYASANDFVNWYSSSTGQDVIDANSIDSIVSDFISNIDGVYWANGSPGAVGGFVISGLNIEAHILIDGNITGNCFTFSTAGPSYSININDSNFSSSSKWRGVSYENSTNTLRFYSDGILTGQINPPSTLGAITNIANSLQNGYLRKGFIWKKLLDDPSRDSLIQNNGVSDSSIFIGGNKAFSRFEPESVAYDGVAVRWYDTSGNNNNALVVAYMVNPKPWSELASDVFNPAGTTTPLVSTTKTEAIKELDAIKLNSIDFPAQFSFEIAGKTTADLADSTDKRYVVDADLVKLSNFDNKADLIGGLVPASQLPSYVDDVLEYANLVAFPVTGATGKIYVALDTNKTYRWSGSAYVEISASLALGETADSAYRGDRGKNAYDHSQTTGNPHNTQIADITGLQNALDGKVNIPLFFTITTTDNTVTPMVTLPTVLDTSKRIEFHLKGRNNANGNTFDALYWFVYKNIGGVVTLIGGANALTSTGVKSDFNNAVQPSITIGGTSVTINTRGPLGQILVWDLYIITIR